MIMADPEMGESAGYRLSSAEYVKQSHAPAIRKSAACCTGTPALFGGLTASFMLPRARLVQKELCGSPYRGGHVV
jgi:hypothetical protein